MKWFHCSQGPDEEGDICVVEVEEEVVAVVERLGVVVAGALVVEASAGADVAVVVADAAASEFVVEVVADDGDVADVDVAVVVALVSVEELLVSGCLQFWDRQSNRMTFALA